MIGAIYLAELRANRLALILLPLLALAMCGGITYLQYAESSHGSYSYRSILNDAFAGMVLSTLVAVGLGLGISHAARDMGQGQWAFVTHRPASPGAILLGKLASALTLYLAVAVPPLAAGILWAATPGNLSGPWDWGMARPALVDLLFGTLYILAGLLLVLREARWFGTRLFPLALAAACSGLSLVDFRLALLVLGIGWAILLAAAWSAMGTRHRPSIQTRPSRLVTGLVLVPASILIPTMAGAMLSEFLRPDDTARSHSYLLSDGQVLDSSYPPEGHRVRVVVNEQNAIVTDAPLVPYKPREQRMQSTTLTVITNPWANRSQSSNYRSIAHYVGTEVAGTQDAMLFWYYVFREDYVVGYKHPTGGKAYITGYIGRNGVKPEVSQVERFAEDATLSASFGLFVIEPQRVYELSAAQRPDLLLFTAPPGEICRDASYTLSYQTKPGTTGVDYVVTTDKALYLLDQAGSQLLRMPHPAVKDTVSIAVTPVPDEYMLLYQDNQHLGKSATFVRLREDGTKLAQIELPPLQPPLASRMFEKSDLPALVLIPPLVVMEGLPPAGFLAVLAAQSVISGAVALLLVRRARGSQTAIVFWTLIALVGGVSGLILMAAARQWPLFIRCPACNRQRRAGVWQCDHCQAGIPAPDPGPIGIFDQTTEPAVPAAGKP